MELSYYLLTWGNSMVISIGIVFTTGNVIVASPKDTYFVEEKFIVQFPNPVSQQYSTSSIKLF